MAETCKRHKQPVLFTKFSNGKRTDMCQVCLYDPVKPRTDNRTADDALLRKLGLVK